jgi:Domain of unknown function (DUF4352)
MSDRDTNAGNIWSRRSRKGKTFIFIVGALLAMSVIGGLSSPSETTASDAEAGSQSAAVEQTSAPGEETKEPETSAPAQETKAPKASSNKATDDNEPHVGPKGSVIVDTLTWQVASAKQAETIGNEYINETADGVFLIVGLQVANGKDESVTINSDQVTLEVDGKEYSTDSDGTTNLMMTEDTESFFLKDLGPDVTTTGAVVFDVPPAVLAQNPEVCFGELGFGSTKGCIALSV